MSRNRRRLAAVIVVASAIGIGLGPVQANAQSMERERLSQALDRLAVTLSGVLAESGPREFVVERIEASKTKVVAFGDLVAAAGAQGETGLAQLLVPVRQIETALGRAGAPFPRLDLKLPVKAHQDLLATATTIYVLAAPLEDESAVKRLRAYSNLRPVTLDVEEPPDVPVLVLIPGESKSLDADYPLEERTEPGKELNPRRVDDFVGIAEIELSDDHESWASGNAEIYAIIVRNQLGAGNIDRVDLPSVNDANVNYFLGDPNPSYLEYSSLVLPNTTIEIWEEDSFAHGADDFVGRINFDWTTLSISGYRSLSSGDVTLGVDRD
jgi:hypothetical protein